MPKVYGDSFVKIARLDPILSQKLIVVLPDRMIKVPPASHMRYLKILDFICDENPLAIELFSEVLPELMLRFSEEKLISFLSEGLDIFTRNQQGAEAFLRALHFATRKGNKKQCILKKFEEC